MGKANCENKDTDSDKWFDHIMNDIAIARALVWLEPQEMSESEKQPSEKNAENGYDAESCEDTYERHDYRDHVQSEYSEDAVVYEDPVSGNEVWVRKHYMDTLGMCGVPDFNDLGRCVHGALAGSPGERQAGLPQESAGGELARAGTHRRIHPTPH